MGRRTSFVLSTSGHTNTVFNLLLISTSVEVERTFSQGRLLLSHVRSRLSVQSTRALLCLGVWSSMGFVKDNDIKTVAVLPEVDGEEEDLADDWDSLAKP